MIGVGETIGNYRITAKLGEGGMGIVYLAEHPVIGKKVALKVIHPELSRNAEVVSRFMTEAKSVNQIGNEHIVDISDFGTTTEGEFYFVMEFLQGESLSDRLKRDRLLPPTRALQIAVQVADALAASHDHGIIHRDLKPENIYLIQRGANKDFVKVLDFGLAKLTAGNEKVSHKTRTGSVMGTPYYMAPEQCEGKPNIDHRADIYSLGIIIYEMLTGRVPFGGEGYGEIIVKHITMQAASMLSVNPSLPQSLDAVVMRALAKDRNSRFQSMAEIGQACMDPDGYAAGAPRVPIAHPEEGGYGAMPMLRADGAPSGVVGLGSGLNIGDGTGTGPAPSTFRGGAGEVMDDLAAVQGRKKGTMIAVAAVLLVALGGGAWVLKSRMGGDAKTSAGGSAGKVAPHPAKVKVSFLSDPAGALVIRSDTGVAVGMTPLAAEIAYSEVKVSFLFKKDGYQDKAMDLVPTMASQLIADMEKTPPPVAIQPPTPPTPPQVTEPAKVSSKGKGRSSGSSSSSGKGKGKGKGAFDEDAVLEPSFK